MYIYHNFEPIHTYMRGSDSRPDYNPSAGKEVHEYFDIDRASEATVPPLPSTQRS